MNVKVKEEDCCLFMYNNRTSQSTLLIFRRLHSFDERNLLPARTASPCMLKIVSFSDRAKPISSSSLDGQAPRTTTTRISKSIECSQPTRHFTGGKALLRVSQGIYTLLDAVKHPRSISSLPSWRGRRTDNVDYIYSLNLSIRTKDTFPPGQW